MAATGYTAGGQLVTGSSQDQLDERLNGVPGFLGTFAADQLPASFPKRPGGWSLVCNYSRSDSKSGGTHWIAMLRLNDSVGRPAYYFDSFGYSPDSDDAVLELKTNFATYLRTHSATGTFEYNRELFQAPRRDPFNEGTCGSYAAFAVVNGPPVLPSGSPNPKWSVFEPTPAGPYAQEWSKGNTAAQLRNDYLVRKLMRINPAVRPVGL